MGTHLSPVVITGIGIILPGANNIDTFWKTMSAGHSQIGQATRFELPGVRAAGEISFFDHLDFLPGLDERHAAKYSREILIVMTAAEQARRDAGLGPDDVEPRRVSVIESSSRGSQEWWHTSPMSTRYDDCGAMLGGLPAAPAALSAINLGARGLVTTISSACVGGHHAIGLALRELRSGASDVVFAGGHEFPLVREVLRCFLALGDGVLSPDLDNPVRPYSADRNGMVLGEGAVVLCLERESTAQARGARAYATVLQHGALNEAAHPMRMDLTGQATAALIEETLRESGRSAREVGYFCGHGTATKANDLAESRTLRALYPDRSDDALPPLGSNKPIFGHTLGTAGLINVAATAMMLHHQELAPTIGVGEPDPECDHDHVTEGSRPTEFDLAVSLAFAIGSQTSVVTLGTAA